MNKFWHKINDIQDALKKIQDLFIGKDRIRKELSENTKKVIIKHALDEIKKVQTELEEAASLLEKELL